MFEKIIADIKALQIHDQERLKKELLDRVKIYEIPQIMWIMRNERWIES
jgi:hypothetical protein